ncbi:ninja-family protein Os03g0419100-like [Pyrus x bretschneideri]|uniref:ninja-family protein Os03g0419100-like n=1 Tax=Pyrus x bretschneideri TaxID=225117 RepID=UPI00202EB811|nr:ninja-family protein Os03g0419100-like [Pyrus x bretschneideri]
MGEVSKSGLKEEEIELDLGLSIGGSFRRPENSKLANGFDVAPRESEYQTLPSQPHVPSPSTIEPSEPESARLDPQTKREMQALRRQEAKRKREEKQIRGLNGSQAEEQPGVKKERTETNVNVNLNLSNGQRELRYPVQYPYLPVHFVPYTNPCVMPCWGPSGGWGFRPFQAHKPKLNNGCETEQNGGSGKTASVNGGLGKKPAPTNVSPVCSSSTVSDHQSAASHEGGGSSESRSHSSQSIQENIEPVSNSLESNSKGNEQKLNPKTEPKSEHAEPAPIPKPISPKQESSPPFPPRKEIAKRDPISKPPKPPMRKHGSNTVSLPQMPYVSTTGTGPNGKTVHGLLYRYTESEITIVCGCHGTTFSPAEFVQHAGGTDVSQPLRHITVIPSAFG